MNYKIQSNNKQANKQTSKQTLDKQRYKICKKAGKVHWKIILLYRPSHKHLLLPTAAEIHKQNPALGFNFLKWKFPTCMQQPLMTKVMCLPDALVFFTHFLFLFSGSPSNQQTRAFHFSSSI
jgi:hypothetical protein